MIRYRLKTTELCRLKPSKEPHQCILIVCEGEKTEPIYFNSFKKKLHLSTTQIEITHKDSAPISIVDYAIELENKRNQDQFRDKYDIIYCVFDVDRHTTLARAINKAKAHGFKVILSNPCFEYWYILHFKKTSPQFHNAKEVVSLLKKKYHNSYCKNNSTIFETIYNNTNQAIKNSKQVINEQHNGATNLSNCNPSTHVHLIVEEFQKMV
jgi:hypothetical protein